MNLRNGDIARGKPITAAQFRITFDDAAKTVLNDFKANDKRSITVVQRRITKHLEPFSGGRRLNDISGDHVLAYITQRQACTEIVRVAYDVTRKDGTIRHVPEQRREARIMKAGQVHLNAGQTKNNEARTFQFTAELRTVLETQRAAADAAQREHDCVVPWVFFRLVAKGRGGPKHAKPITRFTKAWQHAWKTAGLPGRIPHDLRRSAVRTFVRAGISESVSMTLSGHKTRSVFDRYNITSAADLSDASAKLDAAANRDSSVTVTRKRASRGTRLKRIS